MPRHPTPGPGQTRRARRRVLSVGLLAAGLLLASLPGTAAAYPRPGDIDWIPARHWQPAISGDGRYIAYNVRDFPDRLEVWDRETGTSEPVVTEYASRADISADGRYVTFMGYAQPTGGSETERGIYVKDMVTGAIELVAAEPERPAFANADHPAISADGRYVVFQSLADLDDMEPGDSLDLDVFRYDRQTGVMQRVSVNAAGAAARPFSFMPEISADGRYVAFVSAASDLVAGDSGLFIDVFVRDMVTGTTRRVSETREGLESNGNSHFDGDEVPPAISADGRFVAFRSQASNLVAGDTNQEKDVFVRDMVTGAIERVSVASDGTEANGASWKMDLSADGRHVAFQSAATNLAAGDTNERWDVYIHDRQTRTTQRISMAADGTQSARGSQHPAISGDGRHVAFMGYGDLVEGDGQRGTGIAVRDRGPDLGVGAFTATTEAGQLVVSGWATFSGTTLAEDTDTAGIGIAPLGAEITSAQMVYRPEPEDLLLRLQLSSMPPLLGGAPSVVYRWTLAVDGTRYEVRASRAGSAESTRIALYECAGTPCLEKQTLAGSVGTTGPEVLAVLPLDALNLGAGSQLTELTAATGPGDTASGPLVTFQEATLPDATIPPMRVDLGIAPAGTPGDQVTYSVQATLEEGRYTGILPTDSLPAGEYRVWARTCLGDTCHATSTAVTL